MIEKDTMPATGLAAEVVRAYIAECISLALETGNLPLVTIEQIVPDANGCNWRAGVSSPLNNPEAMAFAIARVHVEWNLAVPWPGASASAMR